MRSRPPAARTLPVSRVPTFNRAAIAARSEAAPLNANDELRAATRSPRTWLSTVMISSVTPSAKYSFCGSGLRLTNGSTAIDGPGAAADGGRASASRSAASAPADA